MGWLLWRVKFPGVWLTDKLNSWSIHYRLLKRGGCCCFAHWIKIDWTSWRTNEWWSKWTWKQRTGRWMDVMNVVMDKLSASMSDSVRFNQRNGNVELKKFVGQSSRHLIVCTNSNAQDKSQRIEFRHSHWRAFRGATKMTTTTLEGEGWMVESENACANSVHTLTLDLGSKSGKRPR